MTELEILLLEMAEKEVGTALAAVPISGHEQASRSPKSTVPRNTHRRNGHKPSGNAAAVLAAIASTCDCQPYQDVLPYAEWLRQGNPVRAGQHALVRVPVGRRSVALFCRCQTSE